MLKGSCLCGAVKFEVTGSASPIEVCHCLQCRKWTGHFFANIEVPQDNLKVQGEDRITWHRSSEKVRRGFCGTCGSSLFFDPLDRNKHRWTGIAMGTPGYFHGLKDRPAHFHGGERRLLRYPGRRAAERALNMIRKLTPEDAGSYRRLMLRALKEFPAIFVETSEEDFDHGTTHLAAAVRGVQGSSNQLFGAFDERGELVGAVGIQQEQLPKWRHKAILYGMYVAQSHHGSGIGRKLVDAALAYARGVSGLEQVNLVVGEKNTQARRLYESFGFKSFGVEPRELKVDGQYYDAVYMWLKLA